MQFEQKLQNNQEITCLLEILDTPSKQYKEKFKYVFI